MLREDRLFILYHQAVHIMMVRKPAGPCRLSRGRIPQPPGSDCSGGVSAAIGLQKGIVNMNITYTDEKKFTQEQVQNLFLSVGWVSGQYPSRLYRALMHSSTVITAWDGDRLVGLVRLLDDSELVAYMHYVLVDPAYHGKGIAGTMIGMVKEKYRDYLYIEIMPEKSKNAAFYQRLGFSAMPDGVSMQICNFANKK